MEKNMKLRNVFWYVLGAIGAATIVASPSVAGNNTTEYIGEAMMLNFPSINYVDTHELKQISLTRINKNNLIINNTNNKIIFIDINNTINNTNNKIIFIDTKLTALKSRILLFRNEK